MAASATDKFAESTTNDRPNAATLTAVKANGATSLTCDSTAGWPTDTAVHFTMYEVDAEGVKDASTQRDCKGIVNSSTTINNITVRGGADREFPIGAKVICAPTAAWADDLVGGILEEHNQDGTHGAITATSLTTATLNSKTLADVGFLGDTEYFTSSGTWTKPANLKFIEIEVLGGGGAGGGVPTTSAGTSSAGAGGGAGGYARKKILAGDLGATETVTIGAGGTGVASGNGNTGGQTTFGAHVTAGGGAGGSVGLALGSSFVGYVGGTGGSATGGDLNVPGGAGDLGIMNGNLNVALSGKGADSAIGGRGATAVGGTSNSNGNAAGGYGSGGSGGINFNGAGSTKTGGAGSGGIVIVKEYF